MTTSGPELEILLVKDCFATLNDLRRTSKGNIKYSLEEWIFLALSAVFSGFQTYELIEGFGEIKLNWLRQFYPYKYGIPSHDTLGDFFSRVNQKNLQNVLLNSQKHLQNTIPKLLLLREKQLKYSLSRMIIPFMSVLLFAQKTE